MSDTPTHQPDPRVPPPVEGSERQRVVPRDGLRRLLALALLGSAVAVVIVQLTDSIRHEVRVRLELTDAVAAELRRLEMIVLAEADASTPVSTTIFRFDAEHPCSGSLEHTFELINGRYELVFKLKRGDDRVPLEARRQLVVSGDQSVRFRLP